MPLNLCGSFRRGVWLSFTDDNSETVMLVPNPIIVMRDGAISRDEPLYYIHEWQSADEELRERLSAAKHAVMIVAANVQRRLRTCAQNRQVESLTRSTVCWYYPGSLQTQLAVPTGCFQLTSEAILTIFVGILPWWPIKP